ncbi:MAG: hypothetical protein R3E39_22785 [Anaerolineae bacterium]
MASPLTPQKKLAVRAALVTGSTLSLIFGAQALMTLDLRAGDTQTTTADAFTGQNETTAFDSNSGVVVIRPSQNSSLFQSQQNQNTTLFPRRTRTHSSG